MRGKSKKVYSKSITAYLDSEEEGPRYRGAYHDELGEDCSRSEGKEPTQVTVTAIREFLELEFEQFKKGVCM